MSVWLFNRTHDLYEGCLEKKTGQLFLGVAVYYVL